MDRAQPLEQPRGITNGGAHWASPSGAAGAAL
jgi:hypothetical protein